jgi:hypothetical protein
MTEQEWVACTDPERMLAFLRGRASDRKLRLLACACCRQRLWHLLPDERIRNAVEVTEAFVDGKEEQEACVRTMLWSRRANSCVPYSRRMPAGIDPSVRHRHPRHTRQLPCH